MGGKHEGRCRALEGREGAASQASRLAFHLGLLVTFSTLCLLAGLATPTQAQLLDTPAGASDSSSSVEESEQITFRFRVGVIVTAKRGACRDIYATVAVPIDCELQSVRIVDQEFSPEVDQRNLGFRDLNGTAARQMLVSIPRLPAGSVAKAILTYELTTHSTPPLSESEAALWSIPKRPPADVRKFLSPSPYIESKNREIKRLAREVFASFDEEGAETNDGEATDWRRIEALYDHVLESIDYAEGPDTSAVDTLRDGVADCHGRSALFVAMCRTVDVPSRLVWVDKHCYAEFYLENEAGEGRWFPIESAGTRAFGEMPLVRGTEVLERAVLQRGDNFRVPERRGERLRYASDYLTGAPMPGGGKPSVKYIREVVREEG